MVKTPETMRVQLIAKPASGITGTSRYTAELYRGLQAIGVDVRLTLPALAPIPGPVQRGLERIGLDVEAFFGSYPLRVELDSAAVCHLTSQTLATLLLFQGIHPAVVTVLDIIPYLVRHNPELNTLRHPVDALFYRLALAALRRADAIIAISEYTKRTLIAALGMPSERIHVIYPAVNHEKFRPMPVPDAFRAKYGLNDEWHYILYVGSDDPRKNLPTLVRAFALVKQQVGNVKLLKVGAPHFLQERERLLTLIAELGVQGHVLFFNHVSDEDLVLFYNVADVFVMPSLYEGFGLPVAEAMACGVSVVCSGGPSLCDVAGAAALLADPRNPVELASSLVQVIDDAALAADLRREGFKQVAKFTSKRAIRGVMKAYQVAVA